MSEEAFWMKICEVTCQVEFPTIFLGLRIDELHLKTYWFHCRHFEVWDFFHRLNLQFKWRLHLLQYYWLRESNLQGRSHPESLEQCLRWWHYSIGRLRIFLIDKLQLLTHNSSDHLIHVFDSLHNPLLSLISTKQKLTGSMNLQDLRDWFKEQSKLLKWTRNTHLLIFWTVVTMPWWKSRTMCTWRFLQSLTQTLYGF